MAINFPNNPTNGQEFTSGSQTWVWDGAVWVVTRPTFAGDFLPLLGGTITGSLTVDETMEVGGTLTVGGATTLQSALVSGQLELANAPTAAAHATRKDYVDTLVGTRRTNDQNDSRYVRLAGAGATGDQKLDRNLRIDSSFPHVRLVDIDGPENRQTFQILTNNGTSYLRPLADNGAVDGQMTFLTNTAGGLIDVRITGPLDAAATDSIMTRARGDTRYARPDVENQFTQNQRIIGDGVVDPKLSFGPGIGTAGVRVAPDGNMYLQGVSDDNNEIRYAGALGPATASGGTTILSRRMADARYAQLGAINVMTDRLVVNTATQYEVDAFRIANGTEYVRMGFKAAGAQQEFAINYQGSGGEDIVIQYDGSLLLNKRNFSISGGTILAPANNGYNYGFTGGGGMALASGSGDLALRGRNDGSNEVVYGGSGGPASASKNSTILSRAMGDSRYLRLTGGTASGVIETTGHFRSTTSGETAAFGHGGLNAYIDNLGAGQIQLRQNNNTQLAIDPDGTVVLYRGSNGLIDTKNGDLYFHFNGTPTAVLRTNTSITPSAGTIITRDSGDGRYTRSSSDRDLKQNITNMDSTLWRLMALRPRNYEWQPNASDPRPAGTQYGLIAQEVADQFPSAVIDAGTYKGLDALTLIGVLINSVQEMYYYLEQRIDQVST